ncbi:hypothetical protein [Psychroflexus tropicus]|uniref:hypothetical protein n=1 Tax=Psychroflexus tropicus TaxID=197345 RepID=UPI0012F74666|nr:hypothetical protein [Psychroflexus tropicus]
MKIFFIALIMGVSLCANGQVWLDNTCPIEEQITTEAYTTAKANNLLRLIVDQEGILVMNGLRQEEMSEIKFKETVYDFLTNPSNDKLKADSPKQAIIALGSYGKHEYYDLILRYVREVYLYAWDTASEDKYGSIYMDLNCKKREKIRTADFPYNVIELNNTLNKNNKKPSFSPGVPTFDGDVSDN